ncbi:Testis-specific protease-like protein 50 [Heterocephalus glaber]|uniref:Testis-specific protease-like protein 50 n=1 Tax=Heterocephalus glaber TaxID=10181 RepID=G5ANQ0_HETGA|nr:Testis-specific protease-like protein 50 [Heterocephalus glaber]
MLTGGRGPHGPRGAWGHRARAPAQACVLLLALPLLLPPGETTPQPILRPSPRTCPDLSVSSAGCLGRGHAPRALSTAASADPGELCAPGATCVPRAATCAPGKPRLLHQAPTSRVPRSAPKPTFMPCEYFGARRDGREPRAAVSAGVPGTAWGSSFEPDPTLRDAAAMAQRAPWMVSVRANHIHICAGSLIASRWVLAVPHCLTQQHVNYMARVGSPWIDQETPRSADIPVGQVIVSPRYRPQRFCSWIGQANNIGLLKLQHTLNYSKYVWPICLQDLHYELEPGCRCTVMGWGLSRADGKWPQFRTIQEKEVSVLDNKECAQFYHIFSTISSLVWIVTSQMICATDPSREHFCQPPGCSVMLGSIKSFSILISCPTLPGLALGPTHRQHVNYMARVGSPWIDQETPRSADIPVGQVIVSPRYRPQRFCSWIGQANNIGLLKLQHTLNYSKYVWPICLQDLHYELEPGCRCTVMGWGLSRADGKWPQFRTIQEKEVSVLDNKECAQFYHIFSTISSLVWIVTSQMICATDPSREHFCQGTSYLVGLVSWGAGCRKKEAQPIFLRVSPYQSWIGAQLGGQPLGLRAPSRALLLALPLPLSLLAAL